MSKIIYSGIFFDSLPENIKPDFKNTPQLIHITDVFRPSNEQLKDNLLGKKINVQLLGIGNNNRSQALLTKDNILGYRHITISWNKNSTPKESKYIKTWDMFKEPIIITGTYGYYNGKGIIFNK